MKQAPWNSWLGLTEGDMAIELAEYAFSCIAVEPSVSLSDRLYDELLSEYQLRAETAPEGIRKEWWLSIGRHNTEDDDNAL